MGNTEVRSPIDGVIQKIDTTKLTTDDSGMDDMDQDMSYSDTGMTGESSQNAFITILSTGAYRIKGTVNEMNVGSIIEGELCDHPFPCGRKPGMEGNHGKC
ncbi:MAG: hypothetical protein ACLTX6_10755 [Lachnospiraceae bacterium]